MFHVKHVSCGTLCALAHIGIYLIGMSDEHLSVGKKGEKMIAVPSKAVIFDKNKNFVMIYHERCNLETREIKIDHASGNYTYIRAGLKIGEKVMSKYQLLVYDALND